MYWLLDVKSKLGMGGSRTVGRVIAVTEKSCIFVGE